MGCYIPMLDLIPLVAQSDVFVSAAKEFAQAVGLQFLISPPEQGYYFSLGERLSLFNNADKKGLTIDFCAGEVFHRVQHGGNRSSLLAKAIGARSKSHAPTVLDATAGFGQDAFVLASLGCQVKMLERSNVMFLLLSDALQRAMRSQNVTEIANRLSLIHADAIIYLPTLTSENTPDVLYLDPMFPHLEKQTALVKKPMRVIREVVGGDDDAKQLLEAALSTSVKRIVVKRMKTAPTIAGIKPSQQIIGKTNRYDLYLK